MEMVADRLWRVGDGSIRPFDGDMDDHAGHVLDAAKAQARLRAMEAESMASAEHYETAVGVA